MKKTLALLALAFVVALARPASTEPTPVPWLLGLFGQHATPAPKCHAACTSEEEAARAEYDAIRLQAATAAAQVAYDPDEAPLFEGQFGRARTALRLAVIAAHETGVQPRLARGACKSHECDGGKAVGMMQLHPGPHGLRLTPTGFRLCDRPAPDCITRDQLLADLPLTMRVAEHILRMGGLSHYTGEGSSEGATSQTIRDWETSWYVSHPPPARDADIVLPR